MRKKLVAGNWKMHGSRSMAQALVAELSAARSPDVDLLVIPPFPYVALVASACQAAGLALGAQDLSEHEGQGAYTGEVSGAMLKDVGAE